MKPVMFEISPIECQQRAVRLPAPLIAIYLHCVGTDPLPHPWPDRHTFLRPETDS